MPAVYDQIKGRGGAIRYRKDKKNFVGKDAVPEQVLEALTENNVVDENGLVIVDDKGDFGKKELEELQAKEGESNADSDSNANDNGTDEGAAEDPSAGNAQSEQESQPAPAAPATPVSDVDEAQPLTPSVPEKHAQDIANTPVRAFKSKTPQSKPGMGFPRKNGKTGDIFDVNVPHVALKSVGGHMVPLSAKNYREKTDAQITARLKELGFDLVELDAFEQAKPKSKNDKSDDWDDQDGTLSDDI